MYFTELRAAMATIRARWEHGHDGLTRDCALCISEATEVRTLIAVDRALTGQHETRWPAPNGTSTIRTTHQKGPL